MRKADRSARADRATAAGSPRSRVETIDGRFETIDQRFDKADRRIEILDQRMERHFMWMVGIQFSVLVAVIVALIQTSAR